MVTLPVCAMGKNFESRNQQAACRRFRAFHLARCARQCRRKHVYRQRDLGLESRIPEIRGYALSTATRGQEPEHDPGTGVQVLPLFLLHEEKKTFNRKKMKLAVSPVS